MFAHFQPIEIQTQSGVTIRGLRGGDGPPLLLLHGYPQSHVMWHRVAPQLAEKFTVIATDLRGYGKSDKPAGLADHRNYSKRAMAQDQFEVMQAMGFDQFFVCAHDRGARVAHRLVADFPAAVKKLMLLDISPTLAMYEQTSMAFAQAYWWWFFLIQPAPFPETLIAAAPDAYLQKKIGYGHAGLKPFTDETYAAYLSYVCDAATIHSMCEDYRAAATIDLIHDREDRARGVKLTMPLHVLWGEHGVINRCFQPLDDWRAVANEVTGKTLPCGHYIAEEMPDQLLAEMMVFFRAE